MAEIIEKGSISKAKVPKFNPEGSGYDMKSALACGLSQDPVTGHWDSRCPSTGQLLKGKTHETWDKLVSEEKDKGFEIYKGDDGKYYSRKKEG